MAPSLIGLFKAFLRYRWWSRRGRFRSLRRDDLLGRVARWLDPLARLFRFVFLLPAAALVAVSAVHLGLALASGKVPLDEDFLTLLRSVLCALTVLGAVLPLVVGSGDGAGEFERFWLLPIPRAWLYRLACLVALADPWYLVPLIAVLFLPLGLAGSGIWGATSLGTMAVAACLVALAGLFMVLANAALGLWILSLIQRALRNRRRAEAMLMVGLFAGMAVGCTTMLLGDGELPRGAAKALLRLNLSGELFVLVLEGALTGRVLRATVALGVLGACLAGLLRLSGGAYERLLLMGTKSGVGRSAATGERFRELRLPGMARAVTAVAWVQLRTVWRTVPGKMAIVQAPFLVILAGSFLPRLPRLLAFARPGGDLGMELLLLGFAGSLALVGTQQFLFNTFAIDGAGLTLHRLMPLRSRDLLLGKGLAWGVVLGAILAVSTPLALAFGRPGWHGALGSPLLALLAMACCGALWIPTGLLCSVVLPKQVDLRLATQGNQPHALSLLIGAAMLIPGWAVPLGIIAVALLRGESLLLAVGGLLVWLVLCLVVGRWLGRLALAAWERRREAIGLEAQGR